MRRIRELREKLSARPAARRGAVACLVLCVLLLQFLQLQLSTVQNALFVTVSPVNLLVNLAMVALPTCLLSLFFRRLTLPLALTSALYTLWSVANVYVITYHGSPLLLNELIHARDAADVISGYSFKLTVGVAALLVFDVCEAVCLLLLHQFRAERVSPAPGRIARRALALLGCAAFSLFCLYGPAPTKPLVAMTSAYRKPVRNYGFMTILAEDVYKMVHPFTLPSEDYAPEAIDLPADSQAAPMPETPPDIVLILNETFYDLSAYAQLETDVDYLAPYYDLENARFGHSLSPMVGGGTNDSEYELLTSNSTYLLQSTAPFNYLNMEAPGNSLARYLEGFGYETWGMHCGSPKGYSRGIGYPQLGFDHVLLGPEAFAHHASYGAREWLDEDNFQDLIEQYESGEGPRFLYLLTYQNHGGYEQNGAELDTVHSLTDFGDLTDDVDEYLTSVSLTASAFRKLTEYFSGVERPVIVCMVGDHAPSFINQLPQSSEEDAQLRKRFVPYVIWANYDAALPDGAEQVSMVDLGPMLLSAAGLPLSPYYETILELRQAYPIRLSSGEFVDAGGAHGSFNAADPAQALLKRYFFMEYNSLALGEDHRPELFQPALP